MNCQECRDWIPDYLTKRLTADQLRLFEAHVAGCDECRSQLEQMESAWIKLGELPDAEPGPQVRSRFYAMLEGEKRRLRWEERGSLLKRLEKRIYSLWPRRPALQMATAASFLLIGLTVGIGVKSAGEEGDLVKLRGEVEEMRQMMTLSLLKQSASSERLRGVNLSTEVDEPSDALLTSLKNALDSDPNVNVRMAAVDALAAFRDKPGVLDAVAQALTQESSPLVQIALIDLLIEIQEKKALEALRNFIRLKNVDPAVKEHAQDGISVVM
jgi:anti-sigma factor RsiW